MTKTLNRDRMGKVASWSWLSRYVEEVKNYRKQFGTISAPCPSESTGLLSDADYLKGSRR